MALPLNERAVGVGESSVLGSGWTAVAGRMSLVFAAPAASGHRVCGVSPHEQQLWQLLLPPPPPPPAAAQESTPWRRVAAAASFSWLAFDAKSLPGLLPTLDDGDDDDGGGGGGGASGGGHAPWRGSILQRLRCRVRARDERFRDYVSPSSALSRFSRKTDLT